MPDHVPHDDLELAARTLVSWIKDKLEPKPCAVEFRVRGTLAYSCWVATFRGREVVTKLAKEIVRRANGANPSVAEALFAELTAGMLLEENSTHWFPSGNRGEALEWLGSEGGPSLTWREWIPVPEAHGWMFSSGPHLLTGDGKPLSVADAKELQDAALSDTPWTYLLAARPDGKRLSGHMDEIIVLQLVWSSNRRLSEKKKKELVREVSHFSTFLPLQLHDPRARAQVAWNKAQDLATAGFRPGGKWPHHVTRWSSDDFNQHHPELERIAGLIRSAVGYLRGYGDWDEAVRRLGLPPCNRTVDTCWHAWVAKVLAGGGMHPLLLPLVFHSRITSLGQSQFLRTSLDPLGKGESRTWPVTLLSAMVMLEEEQKEFVEIGLSRDDLYLVCDFDLRLKDDPARPVEQTALLLTDAILYRPKDAERGKTTTAFAVIREVAEVVSVGRSAGALEKLHVSAKFNATIRD